MNKDVEITMYGEKRATEFVDALETSHNAL